MDSLKNAVGMGDNKQSQPTQQTQGGGFLGGIGDKLNTAAGGGRESEKNEDLLDKGKQFDPGPSHCRDYTSIY